MGRRKGSVLGGSNKAMLFQHHGDSSPGQGLMISSSALSEQMNKRPRRASVKEDIDESTDEEENLLKLIITKGRDNKSEREIHMRIQDSSSNCLYEALQLALQDPTRDVCRDIYEFVVKDELLWAKYCHHIYLQHQKSQEQLRDLDLTKGDKKIHERAKELYRQCLEQGEGSTLELIFGATLYELNVILIQFMPETQEFYVYRINPDWSSGGGRRRDPKPLLGFLNVASTENGKWRLLELLPEGSSASIVSPVPTGIYKLEFSCSEKTVLYLRKKDGASQDFTRMFDLPRAEVFECNLQLFHRLISGAARLDEFTFTLGLPPPTGHGVRIVANSTPSATATTTSAAAAVPTPATIALPIRELEGYGQDSSKRQFTLEPATSVLLAPRVPQSPSSNFAFKSLETLRECQEWVTNVTQNPLPKTVAPNVSLTPPKNHNYYLTDSMEGPGNTSPVFRAGQSKNSSSSCSSQAPVPPLIPTVPTQSPLNPIQSQPILEFQPLDASNVNVLVAQVQDGTFGSPQIILRFEPGAKLTQEANHHLFLRPLHSSIHSSLLEPKTSNFSTARVLTSEFEVRQGSTFNLSNPGPYPVCVRCAWFTTTAHNNK